MGRHVRAVAVATAGLLAAMAPVVATSEPAAAARSSASAESSLTFARVGDGAAVTCTAGASTTHNTDDADHPFVQINETFGFLGAFEQECFDDVLITLTVTYTDVSGRTQTTRSFARPGSITVGGAASNVTVQMKTTYLDCDANASATCDSTVSVSPK